MLLPQHLAHCLASNRCLLNICWRNSWLNMLIECYFIPGSVLGIGVLIKCEGTRAHSTSALILMLSKTSFLEEHLMLIAGFYLGNNHQHPAGVQMKCLMQERRTNTQRSWVQESGIAESLLSCIYKKF